MKHTGKGFFLFFDWIDDLDQLRGAEAWKVVKALCEYHRSGSDPTELVGGASRAVVSLMFRQIKRAEEISKVRRAAVNTRYQSNHGFVVQTTTTEERDTIYSHSFTLESAHAHTREEDTTPMENSKAPRGDRINDADKEARERFRKESLERLKRKYLGGTLGQGVVMLSPEQFDSLCEELSVDELNHYMDVIASSEQRGHHYTKRTHYQAILDMAKKDRQTKGG